MSFNSASEVEDKIKDNETLIENLKTQIKMHVAGNPKDIVPADEPNRVEWLNMEMNHLFDALEELYRETSLLYQYKEYLETESNK